MKKTITICCAVLLVMGAIAFTSCDSKTGAPKVKDPEVELDAALEESDSEIPMKQVTVGQKTYNVADITDQMTVYKPNVNRDRCFFVISKKEYRLYVYEVSADKKDTALVAHFPVCYAVNKEAKTMSGDMCTPECSMDNPFKITQIVDATTWCHDFGDGRGEIKAYGAWFMRLETPGFKGVGIHGSTNNAASVPGRDSEGCIRLRDADLLVLHDSFAAVGIPVIIKSYTEPKLPFEVKAQEALGDKYKRPVPGYPMPEDATADAQPTAAPVEAADAAPADAAVDAVVDGSPIDAAPAANASTSLGAKPSDAELQKLQRPTSSPKPSANTKKPAANTKKPAANTKKPAAPAKKKK